MMSDEADKPRVNYPQSIPRPITRADTRQSWKRNFSLGSVGLSWASRYPEDTFHSNFTDQILESRTIPSALFA